MAFIKHVGKSKATGQRLVVVFMQLPDEPDNALVVYSDSLPDRYHQSLMDAVESPEGQSANQLYEVLSRKVFWHGTQMLQTLHQESLMTKVATSNIIMTPTSNASIGLNELLEQMANESDEITAPTNTEPQKSQTDINVEESKQDENKQIAQNLLIQAQLLEQDAEAKRQQAYKYDPSLKPKQPTINTTDDSASKKRGRPKKETTA